MSDSTIRKNIQRFHRDVEMPGGYTINTADILKTVDLYYNGRFKTGAYDSTGFRKYFYNIVKPACDVAEKFIDLDTKDLILKSEKSDEDKVWIMQKDLKAWIKVNKFGITLNEISHNYPKYGHVVIKKMKSGEWELVPLHNLRTDPTAEWLKKSDFVYEVHRMTKGEIEDMPWDEEKVQQLFDRGDEPDYSIYECYTYNTGEGKKWKRYIKADVFTKSEGGHILRSEESKINDEHKFVPALTLHEDEVDDLPYRELKWESVPGRWLGFGFVEYLFDNQISINELVNLKRKGLYFTSLHLFQTRDETIGKNIMDMENGQIIKSASELSPIATEERNLAFYNQEEQRWDVNTERKTFSLDISRGENLPSQTPLGVANLQLGQVTSYFDMKKEQYGLFIKFLMMDDVIPSFKEKTRKEHVLTFLGGDDDIPRLDRIFSKAMIQKAVADYAMENGFPPNPAEIERERARVERELRGRNQRKIVIPDGFYDDVEYDLDVIVTGESVDTRSTLQTLQTALQLVGSNPQILADPGQRTTFFKMLELAGVSPLDLNMMEQNLQQQPPQMLQQGGSVGVPTPGGGASRVQNQIQI